MANETPVLHLVVIGFHHKKGYQVDYSYPPLFADKPSDSVECPDGWKYLPTLALPDGSHNFAEDTVFFNLPSLKDLRKTVYGISCYRQIPVEKLKIKAVEYTRSTVQKAVCALVSRPLYGYIEVKLSLIAQSFFDQGDFSNTDIIRTAYDHLNVCLIENNTSLTSQIHVGLSIRDIVLRWRHKTLILFKLMLLQKRVVCFGSPVRPICTLILGILSLHPNLLESGFDEAACVRPSRPISPMPEFADENDIDSTQAIVDAIIEDEELINERKVSVCLPDPSIRDNSFNESKASSDMNSDKPQVLPRDISVDAFANTLQTLTNIDPIAWNAPIPIFTNGTLCLPYLSLSYLDLLSDPSVNGFIIGTSNILFRQKRQLMDIFIDVEQIAIEAYDPELRRQISLSTEDLRFIDFIVRNVQFPKEDAEGSEQWIRKQFHGYMLAMLRTTVLAPEGSKDIEHFNGHFMSTWKQTDAYNAWLTSPKSVEFNFKQIYSGHPFAGTLSVGDMKLKLAQTMNNSESARKLNQAMNNTSKAVVSSISQAKEAFSSFWSTFTAPHPAAPTTEHVNETQIKVDTTDAEQQSDVTEPREGVIKQIAKKLHNSDLSLKQDKDTSASHHEGIVEIGREANTLDAKIKNTIIDI
ncbi:late secretory pathway protein AVL9 homolog [Contarinia nasturtii]|uniref:late secretory pathway protein AVL9 homolog n=1 Tax=Contarinia nasturtii TaxID=265458 RepID=UPI0012D3D429|nr:late secretory pathway protein AVL9 homolog [Contarinia nasturtii]